MYGIYYKGILIDYANTMVLAEEKMDIYVDVYEHTADYFDILDIDVEDLV